jgi:hypothetical protein
VACQRTVSSEYSDTLGLVPGEINGEILKFLSGKELLGFKAVSKSAKSLIKTERE